MLFIETVSQFTVVVVQIGERSIKTQDETGPLLAPPARVEDSEGVGGPWCAPAYQGSGGGWIRTKVVQRVQQIIQRFYSVANIYEGT